MPTVVVSGALANRCANGGGAWVRLNWLLGLRRLGCEVYFVEEIAPGAGVESNLAFFRHVLGSVGLSQRAVLTCGEQEPIGLRRSELSQLAEQAELLINLGGHLASPSLFEHFRRKAYVDLDPGYTQGWHASGNPGARLQGHDVYFTVGTNIGMAGCSIPTCGLRWHPILPPVVLEEWPVVRTEVEAGFTTIASWRGPFGPPQIEAKTPGVKAHEFRKFVEMPRLVALPFEIALQIHPGDSADRDLLLRNGWRLVDPVQVAGDPAAYRTYLQRSVAEFSAAQGIYVETNSGWFSDRTAGYLASGKPALVQDTGLRWEGTRPAGLVPFRTLAEAKAGAELIARDYDEQSAAARRLAEQKLDSDRVLSQVLETAGLRF